MEIGLKAIKEFQSTPSKGSSPQGSWHRMEVVGWRGGLGCLRSRLEADINRRAQHPIAQPP